MVILMESITSHPCLEGSKYYVDNSTLYFYLIHTTITLIMHKNFANYLYIMLYYRWWANYYKKKFDWKQRVNGIRSTRYH